jgi:hypothetical protein
MRTRPFGFVVLVGGISLIALVAGAPVRALPCVGDCNGNGEVTVNELIVGVNISLETAAVTACPSFDTNGSGSVTVNELIQSVNAALEGCTPVATPTRLVPTTTPGGATPTPTEVPLSPAQTFPTSLHALRTGQQTFYRRETGGFENLTNVPYGNVTCQNCHAPTYADGTPLDSASYAPSCRDCHTDPANPDRTTITNDTCYGCHSRQNAEKNLYSDVHRDKGFKCYDCHTSPEIHGDGTEYPSLLATQGPQCATCHPSPPSNQYHLIHGDKLDCSTCHMQGAIACLNCHFNSETSANPNKRWYPAKPDGSPGGVPLKGFKFLVNFRGKVYPATMMSLVYKADGGAVRKFYVLAPYYAHSIAKNAVTGCADCHNNAAVQQYNASGQITVTTQADDGAFVGPQGVIPIPPDWSTAFQQQFFDYTGDPAVPANDPAKWVRVDGQADLTQMIDTPQMRFGSPLTTEQLRKIGVTR